MVWTSVPVQSTAASFDSFIAETSRRPELQQSPPGRTAGGPEVAAERDTLRNFSPGSQPRPSAAQSHRSPTASITTVTVHAANFTVIGRQAVTSPASPPAPGERAVPRVRLEKLSSK